mmetsp:Transcript_292/g.761  ORF Transcript_292/g.761 Transcript_292/m.761 type:complete len:810 (-) Transcript_292:844-3273(-)
MQADQGQFVAHALINLDGAVELFQTFAVLAPPLGELLVALGLDVALKLLDAVCFEQHAGHLLAVRSRGFIVGDRRLEVAQRLQVPTELKVSLAEVDAIKTVGDLKSLGPLPAGAQHLVEQVEPPAVGVQPLCVVQQAELDGHHRNLRLPLRLLLALSQRGCAASMAHVAHTHFRNIQPPSLDAHVGHVLPHRHVLDQLDGFVRLVHVADRQVVAKVDESALGVLVNLLVKANKVSHRAALEAGHTVHRLGDEEKARHLDAQERIQAGVERERVLHHHPDSLVRCEERHHLHLGHVDSGAPPPLPRNTDLLQALLFLLALLALQARLSRAGGFVVLGHVAQPAPAQRCIRRLARRRALFERAQALAHALRLAGQQLGFLPVPKVRHRITVWPKVVRLHFILVQVPHVNARVRLAHELALDNVAQNAHPSPIRIATNGANLTDKGRFQRLPTSRALWLHEPRAAAHLPRLTARNVVHLENTLVCGHCQELAIDVQEPGLALHLGKGDRLAGHPLHVGDLELVSIRLKDRFTVECHGLGLGRKAGDLVHPIVLELIHLRLLLVPHQHVGVVHIDTFYAEPDMALDARRRPALDQQLLSGELHGRNIVSEGAMQDGLVHDGRLVFHGHSKRRLARPPLNLGHWSSNRAESRHRLPVLRRAGRVVELALSDRVFLVRIALSVQATFSLVVTTGPGRALLARVGLAASQHGGRLAHKSPQVDLPAGRGGGQHPGSGVEADVRHSLLTDAVADLAFTAAIVFVDALGPHANDAIHVVARDEIALVVWDVPEPNHRLSRAGRQQAGAGPNRFLHAVA